MALLLIASGLLSTTQKDIDIVADCRKRLDEEQSPDTFKGAYAVVKERIAGLEAKITEHLPNLTEDGLESLCDSIYAKHKFAGGKWQGEDATFKLSEAEEELVQSVKTKRKSDFSNEDGDTEEAKIATTTRQSVGKFIGNKDTRMTDRPKVQIKKVNGKPSLVVAVEVANSEFTKSRAAYMKALVTTAEVV